MIIKIESITNQQAVVRVKNEIVGMYSNSVNASEHASSLVKKSGYKREFVSCKWENKDSVIKSLKEQIEDLKSYHIKFNSREYEEDIRKISHFLNKV